MTINFEDVLTIQKKFKQIEKTLPSNSKRKNFFLAAGIHFNPNTDLEVASKLRPYGGLIGIDNSCWEDRLRDSKILQLHAVLYMRNLLTTTHKWNQDTRMLYPVHSTVVPWATLVEFSSANF